MLRCFSWRCLPRTACMFRHRPRQSQWIMPRSLTERKTKSIFFGRACGNRPHAKVDQACFSYVSIQFGGALTLVHRTLSYAVVHSQDFPFSLLKDVPRFPTFGSQPKVHSGPSKSNVSIRSPVQRLSSQMLEMHKQDAQHLYELLPSREDASRHPTTRRLALSRSHPSSKLVAMLLTTFFLLIALTLALS